MKSEIKIYFRAELKNSFAFIFRQMTIRSTLRFSFIPSWKTAIALCELAKNLARKMNAIDEVVDDENHFNQFHSEKIIYPPEYCFAK